MGHRMFTCAVEQNSPCFAGVTSTTQGSKVPRIRGVMLTHLTLSLIPLIPLIPLILLRIRSSLLIVALSFCGYAWPNEPVKCNTTQQQSCEKQRGTEQSPVFVTTSSPTTQSARDYEHYEKIEKPDNERLITNSTAALAGITFFLALFTGGLWIATYCLIKDSKDTSRKELRAYVGQESVSISNIIEGKKIEIVIKNFGKTIAKKVVVDILVSTPHVINLSIGGNQGTKGRYNLLEAQSSNLILE